MVWLGSKFTLEFDNSWMDSSDFDEVKYRKIS